MGEGSWMSKLGNSFEEFGRRFVLDDDGEVSRPEDDYDQDDEPQTEDVGNVYFEPEEVSVRDEPAGQGARSGGDETVEAHENPRRGRFWSFLSGSRDYDDTEDNTITARSNDKAMEGKKPKNVLDGEDIVDTIKAGKFAIINLELLSNEEKRLICAYINGAVYCLGGNIRRISEDVYVAGKSGLEIDGEFSDRQ